MSISLFGITDLSIIGDDKADHDFSMLTSDERVKHIIEKSCYYGYSGDKVRGLIFAAVLKKHRNYHISLIV